MSSGLPTVYAYPPPCGTYQVRAETHTMRQAAQHDCLLRLLGDGDIEIMYGEEKQILY
jgi:hypothetical protein